MTPDALLRLFDRELFRFLHREDLQSETFRRMITYHMAWRSWDDGEPIATNTGGKRVRPLLALLTAQALAGDYRRALPAALAVQIVHDFSIILDDIMDRDELRRNRPTLWVRYGANHAMTAATGLYIVGLDALQDYLAAGLSQLELRRLTQILFASCLEMHDAQFVDLNWETQFGMTLDQVLTVALGRSALIKCGAELGAAVSTANREIEAAFRDFGALVATAYSIYDDHRGLWGNEEQNGKPLCSDIRQCKKTYPIVAGYLQCSRAGRSRMEALFAGRELGDREIAAVMELLDEADASGITLREVERLGGQALDCLRRPALACVATAELAAVTESLLGGLVAPQPAAVSVAL